MVQPMQFVKETYHVCRVSALYISIYIYIYIIYTYTHIHIRMCPPCNNQIFDLHIPKKQNETPGKKYINFSEPGLKKTSFHLVSSNPICFGPLFRDICFIRWLGVRVQLIFLSMAFPPKILPGIPYTALTSHCFDIPLNHCLAKIISQTMNLSCLIQYWQYRQMDLETWYDVIMFIIMDFFNWHNTSYDSWLILLIWRVTYVVLYDYLNSTMIWAMGGMDMIVWNVAVGHMVCSVMQDP